ncbi:ribosomal protein S18-alanine N-acetyltransferase [Planctomonas sp. JC2975]|uniref:ribosomal protein S18-alanine N-acetyltransferase n=1 Tax=Planctomonas sp. JC2975 TaxID=2729626 RepID=UPI001472C42D|nr:ribosomal protein S18-alanine N-acetyltransferase [Planctomonas sp. JC2975]NNC11809.1 ribosomal protein S18-alanine N-acetyltransferase [Planctomonas sp. JC2975]
MTAGPTLRRATRADLDAIMALETSIFVTDAWSSAGMASELAGEHSHYLVADDDGEVVAYGGLRAVSGSLDADIQTIAVAPGHRRHGLGRRLMVAMIEEAASRGVRDVFLEVRADNPNAQQLYRSLGFEALAVRPHYYQPDDVDAVVMRLILPSPDSVGGGDGVGSASERSQSEGIA